MSTQSLFLEPPQIDPWEYLPEAEARKTAGIKLTSPPSYWSDEITQTLLRDHPYIPAERIVVNFKKKDEAQGNALGFVGVAGAPRASIPVIIVNRELKPLDVLVLRSGDVESEESVGDMQDDQVLPLNEDTFSLAMDAGEIGTPVHSMDVKNTTWSEDGSALRLPFRGRTVIASVMGATEAQKEAFAKLLLDKTILAGFAARGGGSDQAWLEGYDIKTAESLAPTMVDVVNAWLSAPEPGNAVRVKMASAPLARAEAVSYADFPVEVSSDQFLAAQVCCDGGEFKTAAVFEAVDLVNPLAGINRWMIFEDGSYCQAPEKVAIAQDPDQDALCGQVMDKLATRSLHRGAVLSFVVPDGDTTRFTVPAKLASIVSDESHGSVQLSMSDPLGRVFPVVLSRGVKVAMLDESSGAWVLPIGAGVLQLNGDLESLPLEPAKVASHIQSSLPDSLVCAGGQFTLTVGGSPFQGAVQVGEEKMASVLHDWFENGAELLEMVKEAGYVRFDSNLSAIHEEATKQASVYQDFPLVAKTFLREAAMPLDKAVKLAAAIGNPQGADAVLGAGFLTEDNLAEFVGLGGQFEETVGKLARLLLAVRLGFPGDESATVVAMKSLQRVADKLNSAVQEVDA